MVWCLPWLGLPLAAFLVLGSWGCCDSVFVLLGILCGWVCGAELWFVFDFGFPGILGGFLGFGVLRVFWVFGVLDFGLVLVCGSWVVISWWWWFWGVSGGVGVWRGRFWLPGAFGLGLDLYLCFLGACCLWFGLFRCFC